MRFGSSLKSWKTQPMLRRSIGTFERLSRVRSRPPTTILPARRLELLQQQAHERRLARARRADDEDELALVDVEA